MAFPPLEILTRRLASPADAISVHYRKLMYKSPTPFTNLRILIKNRSIYSRGRTSFYQIKYRSMCRDNDWESIYFSTFGWFAPHRKHTRPKY